MAITGSDYLNLAAAVERYIALDQHFKKTKTPHHGKENFETNEANQSEDFFPVI